MYDKEKKSFKLINIILGIVAILLIIFIIAWIIGKGKKDNNNLDNTFTFNINNMHSTAKEVFTNNLPENIGDTKLITLKELYELDLSDKLYYGEIECDDALSYISITKKNATEYTIKTNLVCGDKIDKQEETIKESNITNNDNSEDNKDETNKPDEDKNTSNGSSSNNGSSNDNSCTTGSCGTTDCTVNRIPTKCETKIEYEFVKKDVTCDSGYSLENGKCVSQNTVTVPKEEKTNTVITDAKKNDNKVNLIYADYIKTTTSTCPSGTTKIGDYCYSYTNKVYNTSSTCPSGYTQNGNLCYKYQSANVINSCPTGSTEVNGECVTKVYENKEEVVTCPSGYTKVSGKNLCYKYTDANKKYSEWGNPIDVYDTNKKESTYTYELTKKALLKTITIKGLTTYTYAIYERDITGYTCSSGTVKGSKCYNEIKATVTYKCPSDFKDAGNGKCYIEEVDEMTQTTYCPYGFSDIGNNLCVSTQPVSSYTYDYCPYGYSEDETGKCYKKEKANVVTTTTCPAGYRDNGQKCYKEIKVDGTYYCENANATLVGSKCHLKVTSTSCPAGYKDNGTTCSKTTNDTKDPLYTNIKYAYSTEKYLTGYERTGKQSYITTCVPIYK